MKQKRVVGDNFEIAIIWSDRLTFPPHSHDEYIISCNVSGNEDLTLDGKKLFAPEKATTLYNPGQMQGGDGTHCLASLYLDPQFFQKENISSKNLDFENPIALDKDLSCKLTNLVGLIFNEVQKHVVEEDVFEIIDDISTKYITMPIEKTPHAHDWRVLRVKEILLENLDVIPRLDTLANEVGLNKLSLLRMFTKATGVPPITWQRAQRISAARILLKEGRQAAEVAYETGFSDQAHLIRMFGRAYGISPGQFSERY